MSAPEQPRPAERTPGLVSIVTPSLNSAAYIEETIRSIESQDYPKIEHIVVDGGSTDGTLEILGRHRNLRVLTGNDRGAADAVNRGFAASHGEFFNYVHSDDLLLPGAITAMVRALSSASEIAGVYGEAWWIDSAGTRIGRYPVQDFDPDLLASECFICQPASLLRSVAFKEAGLLDAKRDLTFDYEFWMRFSRRHKLKRIGETLACSRMHRSSKTLGQRSGIFQETFDILQQHYGYVPFRWVLAEVCYRGDGRDQFFDPMHPTLGRYFAALARGLSVNRTTRGRYFAEWLNFPTWDRLRRHMSGSSSPVAQIKTAARPYPGGDPNRKN